MKILQWLLWIGIASIERVSSLPVVSLALSWWWLGQFQSNWSDWLKVLGVGVVIGLLYQLPLGLGVLAVLTVWMGMSGLEKTLRHPTLRLLIVCGTVAMLIGLGARWSFSQWPWLGLLVSILSVVGVSRFMLIHEQRAQQKLTVRLRYKK